ncbi:MAG: Chaperone protein ClpB 1 [Chloroflexi bacterium]|nr:Chaperone protein ClpB 1 [Chloroflexota bacterium]
MMKGFIQKLGVVIIGLAVVIMSVFMPSFGIACVIHAALLVRFRDLTWKQALIGPPINHFKPFLLVWFVGIFAVFLLNSAGSALVEGYGYMHKAILASAYIVLAVTFLWFRTNVGSSSLKSIQGCSVPPDLAQSIKGHIFGQDANIDSIVSLITERSTRPRDRGPVATFMLAGPTGTGKTETARLIASYLRLPMFVVRCNEYTNQWSADRLIGNSASYRNSEVGGELTNALSASPRGVLVLDEIEKADKAIAQVLMTLLDEGTITQAYDGLVINARGWIMFATTNAAYEAVAHITDNTTDTIDLRIGIKDALREHWPPEILGRLDRVLAFRRMANQDDIARKLVDKAVRIVSNRIGPNVTIDADSETVSHMISVSNRMGKYGYRELERYIEEVTTAAVAGKNVGRKRMVIQYFVEGNDLRARIS